MLARVNPVWQIHTGNVTCPYVSIHLGYHTGGCGLSMLLLNLLFLLTAPKHLVAMQTYRETPENA